MESEGRGGSREGGTKEAHALHEDGNGFVVLRA